MSAAVALRPDGDVAQTAAAMIEAMSLVRTGSVARAARDDARGRFRRGDADYPINGAPSMMGAIRTVDMGPFVDGKAQGMRGDTFYAVVEFSTPIHAEALLGYGNWSKPGSKHVSDQVPLFSRKEMRPVWKSHAEINANLESRKVF